MPHGTSTIDPSVFYDERARQEPPSERASERQKERKRNNVLSIASEKERKNVWSIHQRVLTVLTVWLLNLTVYPQVNRGVGGSKREAGSESKREAGK
jgi:hypothetical protein